MKSIRDWVIRLGIAVYFLDRRVGSMYGWRSLLSLDLMVLVVLAVAFSWNVSDERPEGGAADMPVRGLRKRI